MRHPTLSDIETAAERLKGLAVRTPLLEFPSLNEHVGGRVFLKPEIFQLTGSFKFRGAYNCLSQIPASDRANGVVAWSSGNHAQGVAAAAKIFGIPATIVMPKDSPKTKINGTKALGAEIVFFDRYTEDREKIGHAIAERTDVTVIPSYDNPHIVAGQGTVGLEIAQDLAAINLTPDQVLIPCGGGGLSSGSSIALKSAWPETNIYAVEPEFYDDFTRSLKSGARETADVTRPSICDALLTPSPGALPFSINQETLAGGLVVTEEEIRAAMAYAFHDLKLVVEPGGSVALAAILVGKIAAKDRVTCIVLSGGNVDAKMYARIITHP